MEMIMKARSPGLSTIAIQPPATRSGSGEMAMVVRGEWPPNKAEILKVFPGVEKTHGCLFCWGGTIFNPFNVNIPVPIMEHEKVHEQQQKVCGPEAWWRRYLDDPEFRLQQELDAHRKEYAVACEGRDRSVRRRIMKLVAGRLSGPFYGRMLSYEAAKRLVLMINPVDEFIHAQERVEMSSNVQLAGLSATANSR